MSREFDRAMSRAVNHRRQAKFFRVGFWAFVAGLLTGPLLTAMGVL